MKILDENLPPLQFFLIRGTCNSFFALSIFIGLQ